MGTSHFSTDWYYVTAKFSFKILLPANICLFVYSNYFPPNYLFPKLTLPLSLSPGKFFNYIISEIDVIRASIPASTDLTLHFSPSLNFFFLTTPENVTTLIRTPITLINSFPSILISALLSIFSLHIMNPFNSPLSSGIVSVGFKFVAVRPLL